MKAIRIYFILIIYLIQIGVNKHLFIKNFNDILIKKPYEKVCDENQTTPIPIHIDQLSEDCPLLYKSSSEKTGCLCDFKSQTINCIYSNRLNRVPDLYKTSKNLEWSINLKCKNFSHLDYFDYFSNFDSINILDLSGNNNTLCRLSNMLEKNNSSKINLIYLTRIGPMDFDENKNEFISLKLTKNRTKILRINELNLESNQIKLLNLNYKNLVDYKLLIKSLKLSNNQLELIDIKSQLDMCDLEMDNLDLSNNRIRTIEIGFLVFLKRLNISSNLVTSFLIDFYDNKEFKLYYSEICKIEKKIDNSSFMYSNLVDLDFSSNYLSNLPFDYLNIKYLNLKMLNLSSNRIRQLNKLEFSNMNNLTHLSIKSNLIEKLASQSLSGLTKLNYLDLSNNFLAEIPHHFFNDQIHSLETLILNHNLFPHIPKESFRFLYSVKYMYLNQNRIKTLQNYSFGFMYNLLELYLAENEIESIELNTFTIDEQSLLGPGLIEKIDLSYNLLTYLNSSIFSYLTNLRYLILNNNRLKLIEKNSFLGVNHLISLDLSLNLIQNLNFLFNKNFSNLRYLKLSNNQITNLRPGQFSYLKSLNNLDLSANLIRHINNCAFHGLQNSIKKLLLNYNQINRLNSCAFTLNFKYLRFVQILYNPLNCTNNCEFFFTIYNPPYSINYEGVECVNNTQSSFIHCSKEQYEKIYLSCKNQAKLNDCSMYNHLESLDEQNDLINNNIDYFDNYDDVNDSDKSFLIQQADTNCSDKNFSFINITFFLLISRSFLYLMI